MSLPERTIEFESPSGERYFYKVTVGGTEGNYSVQVLINGEPLVLSSDAVYLSFRSPHEALDVAVTEIERLRAKDRSRSVDVREAILTAFANFTKREPGLVPDERDRPGPSLQEVRDAIHEAIKEDMEKP